MIAWWLGQAGLMFKTEQVIVMVDPYLSDSVEKIEPQNKRRVPVDQSFLEIQPDIIVLTHNHLDHTDPDTLKHYTTDHSNVTVLASVNVWQTVQKHFNGVRNCVVMLNRHTVWTERNIRFTAVKAEHSDDAAIGFIMEAEGKKYYITGDTLYNVTIFSDLPNDIDYVFLPVNGRANNMNMTDGKRFCERSGASAVPLQFGLFDTLRGNDFWYQNKIVSAFYKEIKLNGADNMKLKDIFYTENKITD